MPLQTHAVWGSALSIASDVWKNWRLNENHHRVILKGHVFLLAWYPNLPHLPDYSCLPPPAPALAPHLQACRPSRVGGTSVRAAGDAGTRHSLPCSSPWLQDTWWNGREAAQLWPHIPDECPLSKVWVVPKWCIIYLTGKFHSLLPHFTCAPLTLDRKGNSASIWYQWQTAWQSFPGGCYRCIPPAGKTPVIVVVISIC